MAIMRKFISFLSVLFLTLGLFFPVKVLAQECSENPCSGVAEDQVQTCLENAVLACQKSINASKQEQSTLQGAIDILDGNITLQQIQINQTLFQIQGLQAEIADLSTRIGGLNISLDQLSSILVERVGEHYKRSYTNPFFLLLRGNSLSEFLADYKYLQLAQAQTLDAMQRAETQRLAYDEQKTLKEVKQDELEAEEQKLIQQRSTLDNQKQEKANLLAVTQHEESRYQDFLAQAQSELTSFTNFVNIQGGASILSGQTNCNDWGCYYNQRDSQWGNQTMGLSSSTMKEVGCLVTSMAMISTHYGKNLTPGNIAASSSPFFANTAYMILGTWSVNGVTMTRAAQGSYTSLIDAKVEQGIPVIVGLNIYGDSGIDHFIVVKGKQDGQYIMHDPYTAGAHDVKLNEYYSPSSIARVDYVTVN